MVENDSAENRSTAKNEGVADDLDAKNETKLNETKAPQMI